MENLLNSLNIHHLGDNNYVDKVILESNTCIMLVISSSINFFYKKEINILFVSSVQWGLTYYNLPLERIQALKRYIRYKGYNFNLSQFGFFVNQRVNPKIKTINDIIKITGFNDLILEDDYFDISDSCMAV